MPCRQTLSYFTGSSLRGFSVTTLPELEWEAKLPTSD
jgi:hypothetical protein